ncbi:MAG: MFS transporter [Candidatus Izemoplasmatales bacterium]|nr:MFS transporter [bacterium]MDZ4195996.1 MFS transporter [Candidatus Izemoplasmatales bacterium]
MSETVKFKLFYFIRFFGDALFYPFMSIYFVSKGLSESELGVILAITPITTILVNPLWNFLVKDARTSRRILKLMTIIEGIAIILITQVSGFELYALLITLIAFFCSPYMPIQDGFTALFTNKEKIDYTSIRIHASIAYVVASSIAGIAILWLSFDILFVIAGVFFGLTAIITSWIKPLEEPSTHEQRPKRDLKALLKNKSFFRYLIFYTIVIGSVRIGDSFFAVYLTSARSLTTTEYGFIFSAFIVAEVLMMRYLILHPNQFKERHLYIAATVMFSLRFLVYALNMPIWIVAISTLFRGIAWGIILFAHIKVVLKIVKVENVFLGILLITLTFSIYTGLGSLYFGHFIEQYGYGLFYMIHMIIIAIGLVFYLVFPPGTKVPNSRNIQEV